MGIVDRVRWLLLNGLGLGLVPVAPGTFGTLTGVVIGAVLCALLAGSALVLTLAGVALGLFVFGMTQTAFAERTFTGKDPGAIVLDEVVGYLVALIVFAGLAAHPTPVTQAVAFVAFRIFDVLKVPPANRLEEIPGMTGVMLDDVAAGVWAGGLLLAGHALGFL